MWMFYFVCFFSMQFADPDEQMWDNETSGADHVKQSPSVTENSSQYSKRRVADWIDGLVRTILAIS